MILCGFEDATEVRILRMGRMSCIVQVAQCNQPRRGRQQGLSQRKRYMMEAEAKVDGLSTLWAPPEAGKWQRTDSYEPVK